MGAGRIQGFTTDLGDIDTTPQEYMGAIRQDYNADYKYVEFSGTLAVAVGDFCCYVVTDTTLHTVDGTNSALGAGVATAAHPIGSVTYGWIQIRGVATLSTTVGGSPSEGNKLTNTSASNAALTKATAETDVLYGIFIQNSPTILASLTCPN